MKGKIPTLIVLVILILGVVLGVFLVRNRQLFRLGASGETAPKDVRITNLSESTFTVSWTTDIETAGIVKWGESENSLARTTVSETGSANVHSATVTGLTPSTPYFFKINSSGGDFDNNGISWEAQTAAQVDPPTHPVVISGPIQDSTGNPVGNALVYVTLGGGTPLSVVSSQEGNWVVAVSNSRTQDLSAYVAIDESRTLAEISVQAGPTGTANALIYPQSSKPAPPIVIGQSHDFTNLPPSLESDIPQALLEAPQGDESSGFEVPEGSASAVSGPVTLESLDEGEIVATTEPEFFGEGPPATLITITLESDPQTDVVSIPSSGQWEWAAPEGLAPGPHKITISWRDAQGILRSLTRNFVVQAADEPAFVSTPSATPTTQPSATPTPTIRPTATPTPTATKTPTSTPSALPDAGSSTLSIIYTIFALALLAFSGLTFGLSRNKNERIR